MSERNTKDTKFSSIKSLNDPFDSNVSICHDCGGHSHTSSDDKPLRADTELIADRAVEEVVIRAILKATTFHDGSL